MKNFRLLVLTAIVPVIINACDSNSNLDTKTVKEELESRKIKRISEGEILEAAFGKGRKVIDTLQTQALTIKPDSTDSLNQKYRMGILQPLIDLLQQENKAEIKKILPSDTTTRQLREIEKEIFEAYQYNIAQGLKVDDNVQLLENHIFYCSPILENGELKGMWSIFFDKKELIKSIK